MMVVHAAPARRAVGRTIGCDDPSRSDTGPVEYFNCGRLGSVGPLPARVAQASERESLRPHQGHEPAHGLGGMPAIRNRILMVAVVDDDDVAGGGLAGKTGGDALGTRLLPPVPVPHAPAPAGEAIAARSRPSYMVALRHPACGRNKRQGSLPVMVEMRDAASCSRFDRSAGDITIRRRVPL